MQAGRARQHSVIHDRINRFKGKVKRWMTRRVAQRLGPIIRHEVHRKPFIMGDARRLHLGSEVRPVNTLFNCESGDIHIGDRTIFGHQCMVLTGRHDFVDGKRRSDRPDVPRSGYDVHIGEDCWIASGAIILGGVTIGDSVIVAAGAVVAHDVPSRSMVGGVPAKILTSRSVGPK